MTFPGGSHQVPQIPVASAASRPEAGRRGRHRPVHGPVPQGGDRQSRRGRHPRGDRREGAVGRDPQAPDVHRRGDRAARKAHSRAQGAAPGHLRADGAGGSVSAVQAEAEDQGYRREGGRARTAGELALGLRPRRRCPGARGDARDARAPLRRRREGGGRCRRGAGRRRRHPDRAAGRGRSPAPDGAQRVLRRGRRADAEGGRGQTE
jgi:hypothetical protein